MQTELELCRLKLEKTEAENRALTFQNDIIWLSEACTEGDIGYQQDESSVLDEILRAIDLDPSFGDLDSTLSLDA